MKLIKLAELWIDHDYANTMLENMEHCGFHSIKDGDSKYIIVIEEDKMLD